ncbi:hypothetical protein L7F22_007160 [Adiantum nelumboides]|nr:hypothetical protein [Adiantum nelumboides]
MTKGWGRQPRLPGARRGTYGVRGPRVGGGWHEHMGWWARRYECMHTPYAHATLHEGGMSIWGGGLGGMNACTRGKKRMKSGLVAYGDGRTGWKASTYGVERWREKLVERMV